MKSQHDLRKSARQARRAMSAEDREIASLRICDHIVSTRWFRQCRTLACYLASNEEVATWSLIERAWRRNKRVFVPVIAKNGSMRFTEFHERSILRSNRYGLAEPVKGKTVSPKSIDLVITPLVAFDPSGHRIGLGGGYFDKTFAFLNHRTWLRKPRMVGAAFECQRVDQIVSNPWDIPLLDVITEKGSAISKPLQGQDRNV